MIFYIVNDYKFTDNGYAYGEEKGNANLGNAISCFECGSFLTMMEWLPPYEIKLSKGKLGDVIYGTFTHFIVSDTLKRVYEQNGFKGINSFEPVSLYRKGQKLNDLYYYPKIVLSNVHTDIIRSGVVLEGLEQCSTCQKAGRVIKKLSGLYLINEDLITDDVFCTMMLPGSIVCSDAFKQAVSGLANLSFIKAHEYVPGWIL